MDLVRKVTLGRAKKHEIPAFSAGDTVAVSVRVKEGEKERIQVFKGVVLKLQGSGMSRSFTVRKISSGVGVERTFPFQSPALDKVEVLSYGKVRQGRIYYVRDLKGKAANIQSELAVLRESREANERAREEAAAAKEEASPAE